MLVRGVAVGGGGVGSGTEKSGTMPDRESRLDSASGPMPNLANAALVPAH